jgi:hypothetical protein
MGEGDGKKGGGGSKGEGDRALINVARNAVTPWNQILFYFPCGKAPIRLFIFRFDLKIVDLF